MGVDHDTVFALEDLVGLVNSDDVGDGEERLPTPEALADWLKARRVTGSHAGTTAELRAMHRLRAWLREVFELATAGNEAAVIDACSTRSSRRVGRHLGSYATINCRFICTSPRTTHHSISDSVQRLRSPWPSWSATSGISGSGCARLRVADGRWWTSPKTSHAGTATRNAVTV